MHFPLHTFSSLAAPQPPADVRQVNRGDVLWNRPIFKAPPLNVKPPRLDATIFGQDLRRIGPVQQRVA
jgi:hypothetical protein